MYDSEKHVFGDNRFDDDPVELINELNILVQQNRYVFRGYSKDNELFPKLIRDADYSKFEIDFLREFEKHGSQYFHATTPIDFMSYAQHYGIPTRLLDFTYNPFIALSFALYSDKSNRYKNNEDLDYYYILCIDLTENYKFDSFSLRRYSVVGSSPNPDSLSEKSKVIIECANKNIYDACEIEEFQQYKDRNKVLFIDPNQSNQRITVQQGLFMFPMTLNKEEHINLIRSKGLVIKINKRLRDVLLNYLDLIGFNAYRLMPDLTSVCDAVTKNVKKAKKKETLLPFDW